MINYTNKMENKNINIVNLIEKTPIIQLSNDYQNKFVQCIQNTFTESEQCIFAASFYCYLNYDKNVDFVIDLDDVWEWMGFKQKINAKMLLEKHFKINIDYKNLSTATSGANLNDEKSAFVITKALSIKKNGGQNKQTILLTIKSHTL